MVIICGRMVKLSYYSSGANVSLQYFFLLGGQVRNIYSGWWGPGVSGFRWPCDFCRNLEASVWFDALGDIVVWALPDVGWHMPGQAWMPTDSRHGQLAPQTSTNVAVRAMPFGTDFLTTALFCRSLWFSHMDDSIFRATSLLSAGSSLLAQST